MKKRQEEVVAAQIEANDKFPVNSIDGVRYVGTDGCEYCGSDDYVDETGAIYSTDNTRGTEEMDIEKSDVLFLEQELLPFAEWSFNPHFSNVYLISFEWGRHGWTMGEK